MNSPTAVKTRGWKNGSKSFAETAFVVWHHLWWVEAWVLFLDELESLLVEADLSSCHDDGEDDDRVAVDVGEDVEDLEIN